MFTSANIYETTKLRLRLKILPSESKNFQIQYLSNTNILYQGDTF